MQTFGAFIIGWENYRNRHPHQRKGQSLFNWMYINDQTEAVANKIRFNSLDPYDNDAVVPFTLIRVMEEVYNKA